MNVGLIKPPHSEATAGMAAFSKFARIGKQFCLYVGIMFISINWYVMLNFTCILIS